VNAYDYGLDKTDFTYNDANVTATFEVTDAAFTITKASATITVKNAEKVSGTADPVFDGEVVGLVNADDLGTVTYGRTNDTEVVGVYAGVIVPTYTANANYDVTVVPGDFTITQAAAAVITIADATTGATTTNYVASLAEAIGRANDGDTVQLLEDVSEPAVALDKAITLDLNGNDWTVVAGEGQDEPGAVQIGAAVTITDSTAEGEAGTIAGDLAVTADGALTVASGTVDGDVSADGTGSSATVTGGSVSGNVDAANGASVDVSGGTVQGIQASGAGSTVTMTGGTATGAENDPSIYVHDGATGTVSEDADLQGRVAVKTGASLEISGGSVAGSLDGTGGTLAVIGGHFGEDPSAYVDTDTHQVTGNATDGYDVTARTSLEGAVITVAENLIYTGLPQSNIVAVVVADTNLTAGTDYTVTYANNVNAGTAIATIDGVGAWNGQIVTNFSIAKAGLTVTADSKTVEYGTDPATFVYTVTVTGFVNGETTNVLAALPTATCAAYTAATLPGTYEIVAAGGEAANYEFATYVPGVLTVTGEPLPVKPGDRFTQEDIANGVKPVEVVTGGEGGQKFVVRFRRAQTGVVYELVASTALDITEAQWKGVADAGNAVVVDTDDATKDVDELVTLEVEMSAAYPVRFFKIRTHFPTAGNEGP